MSQADGPVPEHLLADVKAQMAQRHLAPAVVPMKHANLWPRRMAIAAAVAALGLFLLIQLTPTAQLPDAVTGHGFAKQEQLPGQPQPQPANLASIIEQAQAAVARGIAAITGGGVSEQQLLAALGAPADSAKTPASRPQQQGKQEKQEHLQKSNENQPYIPPYDGKQDHYSASHDYIASSNAPRRSHATPVSLGAYYSGAADISVTGDGPDMASADPIGGGDDDMHGNFPLHGSDYAQHMHHKHPVMAGLSVRYRLTDRWALQSGLTYSYLSSEGESGTTTQPRVTEQRLHYLGVPVAASYTVMRTKRFELYGTAGAEVQKLVSGKRKTTTPAGNDHYSVTIKEHRPQFSVNAAVGAELKLTQSTSVYVEPGVTRYIDNGSSVDNIYKEKPTNFSLNVGLRINLNK